MFQTFLEDFKSHYIETRLSVFWSTLGTRMLQCSDLDILWTKPKSPVTWPEPWISRFYAPTQAYVVGNLLLIRIPSNTEFRFKLLDCYAHCRRAKHMNVHIHARVPVGDIRSLPVLLTGDLHSRWLAREDKILDSNLVSHWFRCFLVAKMHSSQPGSILRCGVLFHTYMETK